MGEGDQYYELAAAPRSYLRLAAGRVLGRRVILPAALLLLILTATSLFASFHPPMPGSPAPMPFIAALGVRAAAICLLSAAILRLAAASERSAWLPDGAFWLYVLLLGGGFAITALVGVAFGGVASLQTGLVMNAAAAILVSPFAAWTVAAVAQCPLAWRPAPWLRGFAGWLPQRIGWGLLLLVPLGALHSWLGAMVFQDPRWFWPAALADSLIYLLILMIRLGLDAAAYWRVAQA